MVETCWNMLVSSSNVGYFIHKKMRDGHQSMFIGNEYILVPIKSNKNSGIQLMVGWP